MNFCFVCCPCSLFLPIHSNDSPSEIIFIWCDTDVYLNSLRYNLCKKKRQVEVLNDATESHTSIENVFLIPELDLRLNKKKRTMEGSIQYDNVLQRENIEGKRERVKEKSKSSKFTLEAARRSWIDARVDMTNRRKINANRFLLYIHFIVHTHTMRNSCFRAFRSKSRKNICEKN